MIAMVGIGKISEMVAPRQLRGRAQQRDLETGSAKDKDSVELSTTAQRAADAARFQQEDKTSEIRTERVEQAKARIEEGSYRIQEVVLQVAGRVSKYM